MAQRINYLKSALTALQNAESNMTAQQLEALPNRQIMADCKMLLRALDPDYFAVPSTDFPDDFFPFDEVH